MQRGKNVSVLYLFADSEGATTPRFYFKRKRMKIWSSSWKRQTILEPILKANIILIICYHCTDKGCPSNYDKKQSSQQLMLVTMKPRGAVGNTVRPSMTILEWVEISLALVSCRFFFFCRQHFNYERF